MKRLFFALDISPSDKEKVHTWRKRQLNIQAKAVSQNNFHITLAFLGGVSEHLEKQIIKSCEQTIKPNLPLYSHPVTLQFDRLNIFKKPQVLYLDCSNFPQPLINLANSLKQRAMSLNISQEDRPYRPHLTIYRKVKKLPDVLPPKLPLNISTFSLYHSQSTPNGIIYTAVNTWSLVQI